MTTSHHEPGGSWRVVGWAAALLVVVAVLDLALSVVGLTVAGWAVVAVMVLGVPAAGVLSARRAWTVRVSGRGADATLAVGRERVPLADVDAAHLRAVVAGRAGVDAGAPVLGGGGSLPRGRAGLPLRRTDGRTVLVPTRSPRELAEAILTAHARTQQHPAASPGHPGRVEP